jgi:GNAT superfamily N-acetyltransferase
MSEYSIKKLEDEQFEMLIPLMKDCFGMQVDINYFKWKFLENPAGNFVGFVAVHDETNEVAAYYGVIPEDYHIDGQNRKIYQSCDTMTHSNHRRKGLFQKLAIHCYEYLRERNELFVIGFGGGTSTPGFLKFGWKHVFDFQSLFLPKVLCYGGILSNFDDNNYRMVSDLDEIQHLFSGDIDAEIHSVRTTEHLKWRYKNPNHSYQIIAFEESSIIEGFICFYIESKKIFLFDFVFKTKKAEKALVGKLKKLVLKEKLEGVLAFCQQDSMPFLQLKRRGFIANPFSSGPLSEKTPFIFYSDNETMERYNRRESWFITSYDHDAL